MADPDTVNPLPDQKEEDLAFDLLRGNDPIAPPSPIPAPSPLPSRDGDELIGSDDRDGGDGGDGGDDGMYHLNLRDDDEVESPGAGGVDYSADVEVLDPVKEVAPPGRNGSGKKAHEPVEQQQYIPSDEPQVVDPNTASRKREIARKRAAEELALEELARRRRNRIILLSGVVVLAVVLGYMMFGR